MTYVVGFHEPGFNAIMTDSRISWRTAHGIREGRNDDLKTGLLFRGCIFGSIGSASAARAFVRSFKESIHGATDDISGFWRRFERFVERYPFPPSRAAFTLLLSHRGFDVPRFAVLDSVEGLDQTILPHDYYLVAHGSGRDVLNTDLNATFAPRLRDLQQFLLKTRKVPLPLVHRLSPYFLCLWLNERSLTFEASLLSEHGVGGVFHFVWQGSTMEEP